MTIPELKKDAAAAPHGDKPSLLDEFRQSRTPATLQENLGDLGQMLIDYPRWLAMEFVDFARQGKGLADSAILLPQAGGPFLT